VNNREKNLITNASVNPLSAKQFRAVLLIAGGSPAADVADAVGVSKGTVHNWKSQNGEFRSRLELAQRQLFEDGIQQLGALVSCAATALRSVLVDPNASPRDKITAARAILQFVDWPHATDSLVEGFHSGPDEFLKRMGLQ